MHLDTLPIIYGLTEAGETISEDVVGGVESELQESRQVLFLHNGCMYGGSPNPRVPAVDLTIVVRSVAKCTKSAGNQSFFPE